MQLFCKDGRVLAWHEDGQAVAPDAYGAGVLVVPYTGGMHTLGRIGDAPVGDEPDQRPYAMPEIDLAAFQRLLCDQVDAQAEILRMGMVTPGSGQAMEYQEAQAQASAALKAPSTATAAKYPMLAVTIGVDIDPSTGAPATDVLGVARSIDGARSAWVAAGAFIRGVRLTGKKAIMDAATIEAAQATFMAIGWAPPASAS